MRYKAEVVSQGKLKGEMYFKNLSHPNQVVRNVVKQLKGKLSYYMIFVVNESGEMWKYSVMKKQGKIVVRKLNSPNYIFNKDELDMIFTGNMKVFSR